MAIDIATVFAIDSCGYGDVTGRSENAIEKVMEVCRDQCKCMTVLSRESPFKSAKGRKQPRCMPRIVELSEQLHLHRFEVKVKVKREYTPARQEAYFE